MPILFYDGIALMHSPLTRRHQFANKNINYVISITSWADATHDSDVMHYKTFLDTIFIKSIDKIRLLEYTQFKPCHHAVIFVAIQSLFD